MAIQLILRSMQYVVKQGQDIYQVAVILYGSPQFAVKLCEDNGITITDSIEGLTLTYDNTIKADIITAAVKQQNTPKQPNLDYYIRKQQSVYDLALMYGYGINRTAEFCQKAGLDINSIDVSNTIISVTKIPNNLPLNIKFATQADDETIAYFLLMEDDFYLLQESGSKIEL